jgi:hypothetical protein
MYLFTRSRRIGSADMGATMEWISTATETVRSTTGREIDAWAAVMSPEFGTVSWAMWAESLAEIMDAGDKLATSSDWQKLIARGDDLFEGPVVDGLASLVHGTPDLSAGPPDYVGVATAVAAQGRLSDAIGAGIEIADQVTKTTGQNTLFMVNSTGLYGGVAWITPSANISEVDAGETALMADPEWLKLIDRVGTAFGPGAAQAIFRRIA